jgi:hypothetical protein
LSNTKREWQLFQEFLYHLSPFHISISQSRQSCHRFHRDFTGIQTSTCEEGSNVSKVQSPSLTLVPSRESNSFHSEFSSIRWYLHSRA